MRKSRKSMNVCIKICQNRQISKRTSINLCKNLYWKKNVFADDLMQKKFKMQKQKSADVYQMEQNEANDRLFFHSYDTHANLFYLHTTENCSSRCSHMAFGI